MTKINNTNNIVKVTALESLVLKEIYNFTFNLNKDNKCKDTIPDTDIKFDLFSLANTLDRNIAEISYDVLDLSLEYKFFKFSFETFSVRREELVRNKTVVHFSIIKDFSVHTKDLENEYCFHFNLTDQMMDLLVIVFDRLSELSDHDTRFKLFMEFFIRSIETTRQQNLLNENKL